MESLPRFKEKIDAMQKYVPMLTKLIMQLEEEGNDDTESTEKITQLKILLHQLTDPKPDISVEELDECDRVLANLLHLHNHADESKDEEDYSESTTSACKGEIIKTRMETPDSTKKQSLNKINYKKNIPENLQDESKLNNSKHITPIEYKVVKKPETAKKPRQTNQKEKRKFIMVTENGGSEAELILPDIKSEKDSRTSKTSIQNQDQQKKEIEIKDDIETIQSMENKAIKRSNSPTETESNESAAKMPKISIKKTVRQSKERNSVANQKYVNRANERADPLFVESIDESLLLENLRDMFNGNDEDANNDDDDVEIVENRNSPILIDSDDDSNIDSEKQKVIPIDAGRKKCFIGPKSIKQRMELENNIKTETKRILSNIKQLTGKINTLKRKNIPTPPKPNIQHPRTQQTNFLSQIDLQPKNSRAQANPRHFTANVGNKPLQIPNALYSSTPTTPQTSSVKTFIVSQDAAHCRWLDNFLNHFCSPYNTTHNTCFLLLQRALRQDDFARIRKQRVEMQPNGNEVNSRLLVQLKNIFYIDGDPAKQKLTFVGRKFCQLAFVNILDKTISLTVDSRTNTVTSRTRISAATLNSIRSEKSATVTNIPKTVIQTKNVSTSDDIGSVSTIGSGSGKGNTSLVPSNIVPIGIAAKKNCLNSTRNKEDDKEYCPPREVSQILTSDSETAKPRRSLRRAATRSKCSNDNTNYFTYSGDDDDGIDDIEKYIAKKRLDAEKERQRKAQSFETAFIDTIKVNPNPLKPTPNDVILKASTERSTSQTQANNEVTTYVISDDDDDPQCVASGKRAIPKSNIRKTLPSTNRNLAKPSKTIMATTAGTELPKNTNEKVHSMSRFNDFCLLCNRSIARVVGHYVNTHPDDEVFTSRPAPKTAKSLLNNELGLASYDRLQSGLSLYVATCVFCERKGSFTLVYWYHHFASHTGEYAYKCNGCGLRKPTRSQLTTHIQQACPKKGSMEITQQYDLNQTKICAYICRLCNYTQMSFASVLRHLKTQHRLQRTEKRFWDTVVLLQIPKLTKAEKQQIQKSTTTVIPTSEPKRFFVHNANGEVFEIAEIGEEADLSSNNEESPVVVNEAEIESNNDGNWCTTIASTSNYEQTNVTEFEIEPHIKEEVGEQYK